MKEPEFFKIVDEVVRQGHRIEIKLEDGRSVYLISREDYNRLNAIKDKGNK